MYSISWTLEVEKDLRFSVHLLKLQTPLYDDTQDNKHAITAEKNSTTSERIFHKLAVKNMNVNVVKTIYCQRNSIFLAKTNYSIHYLTSQNRGLSGLKSIWPVMMTGDLLSVIFSPAQGILYTTSSFLRGSTAPLAIRYVLMPRCCR